MEKKYPVIESSMLFHPKLIIFEKKASKLQTLQQHEYTALPWVSSLLQTGAIKPIHFVNLTWTCVDLVLWTGLSPDNVARM